MVAGDPNAEIGSWEHQVFGSEQTVTTFYTLPTVLSGNQLPVQPNHKAALTVTYSTTLQEFGSLQLGSTLSYTGSRYPDIGNIDYWKMPAYSRWDLRGTWTSPGDAWSVTAYVQNVLDEIGLVEVLPAASRTVGAGRATLTEPRQFGLQIRWRPEF